MVPWFIVLQLLRASVDSFDHLLHEPLSIEVLSLVMLHLQGLSQYLTYT